MRAAVAILAFGVLICAEHSSAQVFDPKSGSIIPRVQLCLARHGVTGASVPARQRTGHSQHWAHAGWDFDGMPAITYGSAYFGLPPLVQILT